MVAGPAHSRPRARLMDAARARPSSRRVIRDRCEARRRGGCTIALPVKLVSYDRRGHRRLGALTGGRVVDLPDAVGHPAFPTTMESLLRNHGGTILDVDRESLEREDVMEFAVPDPRLLAPLLPSSVR